MKIEKIDISGIDLVKFVKKVYELSKPLGLGHLHFTPEPLTDEEAKKIIRTKKDLYDCIIYMDYVKGRACKMTVWERDGRLQIINNWYDHTCNQFKELLEHCEIKTDVDLNYEHGGACTCTDCKK